MYQDKMQGIIKEKEDLSTSLQHAETKLQKIEADREQLKLQSNQQKESIDQQTKQISEYEAKLQNLKQEYEKLQQAQKKSNIEHESSKKGAKEQLTLKEEECNSLKITNQELQNKIEDFKQLEQSLRS